MHGAAANITVNGGIVLHILNDEQGNPVTHSGHDHCHEHETCAVKEGGTCPQHAAHDHAHHHEAVQTEEQMKALLDYMAKHNQQHAAELDQLSHKLDESGKAEAAEYLRKAVDEFQKGNMYLSLALSLVQQ